MIETVFVAFIIAKLKRYKLAPLLKAWLLYPFWLLQLIFIFFEWNIFQGNYQYVQYAGLMKQSQLFVLILPILVYRQYTQALIGSAFIFVGTFLNKFVMVQNGGTMPVFPSLSYLTGYVQENSFTAVSSIHSLGSADTKWKFLTDIFDLGYSILSIGDVFIAVFAGLLLYNTVKILNVRIKEKEESRACSNDCINGGL